jgi:hypothetical protein
MAADGNGKGDLYHEVPALMAAPMIPSAVAAACRIKGREGKGRANPMFADAIFARPGGSLHGAVMLFLVVVLPGIGVLLVLAVIWLRRVGKCPECQRWGRLKEIGRREIGRQAGTKLITFECAIRCSACGHTMHREVVVEAVIRSQDFVWYRQRRGSPHYRLRHRPTGLEWELGTKEPERADLTKQGWRTWGLSEMANIDLVARGWEADETWRRHMERASWGVTGWFIPLIYVTLAACISALFGLRYAMELLGMPRPAPLPVLLANFAAALAVGYLAFRLGRRCLRRTGRDIFWTGKQ